MFGEHGVKCSRKVCVLGILSKQMEGSKELILRQKVLNAAVPMLLKSESY